jgi:serine/threonine-protein phosphatase 2A regulatory subunit A
MLPKLLSLHVDKNYLHRLTPLFGMAALAPVLPLDVVRRLFLPVILSLQQDPVPNIRMNVAKSIQSILPLAKGSGDLEEKLKTTVTLLANNDPDLDVRYYSQRALSNLG